MIHHDSLAKTVRKTNVNTAAGARCTAIRSALRSTSFSTSLPHPILSQPVILIQDMMGAVCKPDAVQKSCVHKADSCFRTK